MRPRSARWRVALGLVITAPGACADGPSSSGSAEASSWAEEVAAAPCGAAALAVLDRWGAGPTYTEAPVPVAAARQLRIPTGRIGEWLIVDVEGAGPPALSRVTDGTVERVVFDDRCAPAERREELVAPSPNERSYVTDAELRSLLDRADAVRGAVVYVWSPHMPLSVDGYAEIAAATEALGMALLPVLMPGADPEFAAREAGRAGVPVEALREPASLELTLRDAFVHAPAIVVYGGGRVSPVLPGYRSASGYRAYLESFLSAGS